MNRLVQLLVTWGFVVAVQATPLTEQKTEAESKLWAVLVAGSNGFANYRHQADICHAYQIFHRHGIPDSNIIVMMYDDIAYNEENPRKGVIINKPDGPNVYVNVLKDYTGNDVTPDNFFNILTGNKKAMLGKGSGKVLESGPDDHVFVNFVDHGGPGLICFPNNDQMFADKLLNALEIMNNKKMYKKLVFYMEACESGSMFDKFLPANMNILATTAANTKEPSWAVYEDDTIGAFIGDAFSVAWMEDIDSEEHHMNLTVETLLTQFKNVVKRVSKSHPSMYGDKPIDKDKVIDYIGVGNISITNSSETFTSLEKFKDVVSSRDVALHLLESKIKQINDEDKRSELIEKRDALIAGRHSVDELFSRIVGQMDGVDQVAVVAFHKPVTMEMMPCYKAVVQYFTNNCVNINKNTYALAHLYKLANLCTEKTITADYIIKVISKECKHVHREMEGVN